jgi:hypothetical protein
MLLPVALNSAFSGGQNYWWSEKYYSDQSALNQAVNAW